MAPPQKRILNELLTVTVGALGVPTQGIGIASVDLDLDGMNDAQIGAAMGAGFRAAHSEAVRDFGPKLTEAWASNPDRFRDGDPQAETES